MNIDIIVYIALGIIAMDSISLFYYIRKEHAPVRTTVVQIMGVILFVPLVFLLSLLNRIDNVTIATLLGAFAGYIFGKIPLREEWGSH